MENITSSKKQENDVGVITQDSDREKLFIDFSNEIKEVVPTLNAIADKYKIYLGFSIDLLAGKFYGHIEGDQFTFNDPRFKETDLLQKSPI